MQEGYVLLNDKFFNKDELVFNSKNRAFAYGDALFETIHCLGTIPQFLDLHWNRLGIGMQTLRMVPGKNLNEGILQKSIEKLLNRNRIFKGARVRLTVYRDQGGLYTPDINTVSWMLEATPLEEEKYEINHKGLVVDIYDEVHKPVNMLSNLKTTNALIFVLAGLYRKENGLDECLVLNQYGRIIESISSNIFVVLANKLITPPLSDGCISGAMRHTVMAIAPEAGYEVEEKGLLEKHILDAEELLLTNAIQGIKWVGAYKDRRYYNFAARKLVAKLNEVAFML